MLSMICSARTNRPRRRRGLRLATFAGGATLVRGGGVGGEITRGAACGGGETGRLVAFTGDIGRVSLVGGAACFARTGGAPSNRGFAVATVAWGSGTQCPGSASGHGSTAGCNPVVPGMCGGGPTEATRTVSDSARPCDT